MSKNILDVLPKINEKQYFQAFKRIMDNEAGLYEKIIDHFELSVAQKNILFTLEQRRIDGQFMQNK